MSGKELGLQPPSKLLKLKLVVRANLLNFYSTLILGPTMCAILNILNSVVRPPSHLLPGKWSSENGDNSWNVLAQKYAIKALEGGRGILRIIMLHNNIAKNYNVNKKTFSTSNSTPLQ